MSHSKRNTSLAFFTSHERSLLRSTWGTRSTRLGRDAFLPFGACLLCLQPSRSPCACPRCGGVFCRECAVQNLLAQRKEIQRLEKEEGRKKGEAEQVERDKEVEERERAVRDFEAGRGAMNGASGGDLGEGEGKKRKRKEGFELDEGEMRRGVLEERKRARREIDEEKAAKPTLPSFWVPSLTPSTHSTPTKPQKLHPLCPASSPSDTHPLSLKSLVTVSFSTGQTDATSTSTFISTDTHTPICPACDKTLSNTLKATMTVPCGHVLCKPCAGKFMAVPTGGLDPHEKGEGEEGVRCFVCETDLTARRGEKEGKGGKEKGDKEGVKPGLVEIRSEGTGFAGGGTNMATREGVAFQC